MVGNTKFLVKIIYPSKKQDHQKEKTAVNMSVNSSLRKTEIINTDKECNLIS